MIEKEIKYINFNVPFYPGVDVVFTNYFKTIENTDQEIIPIKINSPGGYVTVLQAILDIIDSSKKPVATFCTGMAASCGAALFLSGTDGFRYVGPNSRLMIHQVSGIAWGKTSDVESELKLMKQMTSDFVYKRGDLACKKEGYTYNLIKENMNSDLWLSSDECIDHGYADKIGVLENIKDDDFYQNMLKIVQ